MAYLTKEQEKLFLESQGLVHTVIRKYYPTYLYDEDIKSIGIEGLMNACKAYDPERNKFTTFACKCIYNQIARYFYRFKKDVMLKNNISFDEPVKYDNFEVPLVETIHDRNFNLVEYIEDELYIKDFIERMKKELYAGTDIKIRSFVELYIDNLVSGMDLNIREMSEMTNISYRYARQVKERTRKKMIKFIIQEKRKSA